MSTLSDKLRQEVAPCTSNYEGQHRTTLDGWMAHRAGTRVGSCSACLEAFLKEFPEDAG